jgi:hypothetical protein
VNNDQIKSVAVGFLHALQSTPAVYQEWIAADPGDTAKYASIVQNAMHLAAAPTQADLEAMDAYLHDHLQEQLKAFVTTHPLPPRTRMMCLLSQS